MAKDWRCLIGRHDWHTVETADRDKYAECTRCGKSDWRRLMPRTSGTWRGQATCLRAATPAARDHARLGESGRETWRLGAPNLANSRAPDLSTGKRGDSGRETWRVAARNWRVGASWPLRRRRGLLGGGPGAEGLGRCLVPEALEARGCGAVEELRWA